MVKPGSKINDHTEGSGSPASMYIVCVADLERANTRWSLCSTDTFTSLSHITAWKEQTLKTEMIKTTILRQHISMCRQLVGLVRRLHSSVFSDNINGICEIASNCPTSILLSCFNSYMLRRTSLYLPFKRRCTQNFQSFLSKLYRNFVFQRFCRQFLSQPL